VTLRACIAHVTTRIAKALASASLTCTTQRLLLILACYLFLLQVSEIVGCAQTNEMPPLVVTPSFITEVAGNGLSGYSGDGASALLASLRDPSGVTVDQVGNIYIADTDNNVIREVNKTSGIITTVVGNGQIGYSGDGGPAINASLASPSGLAINAKGELFIADSGNNVIRKIDVSGTISTVAGSANQSNEDVSPSDNIGDEGLAINAVLWNPTAVAIDADGNLFIADTNNNRIRRVDAVTQQISTIAGNGSQGYFGDGAPAASATVCLPGGLAVDTNRNLFIADTCNNVIRRIDSATQIISTVAGGGSNPGVDTLGDGGPATEAQLFSPCGIAVDAMGNLYIADTFNNLVRQVNARTGMISLIAGVSPDRWDQLPSQSTTPDYSALDYPLDVVAGIAVDNMNNLYIVDGGNAVVQEVALGSGTLTFTSSSSGAITLTNVSLYPVTPGEFSIVGPAAGDFTVITNSCTQPLSAGASCQTTIDFSPSSTTLRQGELQITNSLNSSVQSVQLIGSGVPGAGGSTVTVTPATGGSTSTGAQSNSNPQSGQGESSDSIAIPPTSDGSSSTSSSSSPSVGTPAPPVCAYSVGTHSLILDPQGGTASVSVTSANCSWTAVSNTSWLSLLGVGPQTGPGQVQFTADANPTTNPRSGALTVAGQTVMINQQAVTCTYSVAPTTAPAVSMNGGGGSFSVSTPTPCSWSAGTSSSWLTIANGSGRGNGTLTYTVSPNGTGSVRSGSITVAGQSFLVTQNAVDATPQQVPAGLRFVPITPCRIADTRNPAGPFGGPTLAANTERDFAIPQSGCSIPASAKAYSLNVGVAPAAALNYLTVWPTGQSQPFTSTLNSIDGRIKANATIIPAGTGGDVSVYASDKTDVFLDINGYFVPATDSTALAFYPLTPCRVLDTRNSSNTFSSQGILDVSVGASNCSVPATAQAYSLNVTALPKEPLIYLSLWPTGQPQPFVSTLNALTQTYTANAAIVPTGENGQVSVFATNKTDVVVDINGYFAPPGPGGLSLYPMSPCRVTDTRDAAGAFSGLLSVNVASSRCAPPSNARAFVANATAVPKTSLWFLSLWADGEPQPLISTLNAPDAMITSNMAIVPTVNGSIDIFASNETDVFVDISGYFAP
jgi:sugar lactone lactonase YvrE